MAIRDQQGDRRREGRAVEHPRGAEAEDDSVRGDKGEAVHSNRKRAGAGDARAEDVGPEHRGSAIPAIHVDASERPGDDADKGDEDPEHSER